MKSEVLRLEGLDCADCAAELEKKIKGTEGVTEAAVDFMAQKAFVTCEDDALCRVEDVCNRFEEVRVVGLAVPGAKERVLQLEGLDCATCAAQLEGEIKGFPGVESASIDFMTQKLVIVCDDAGLEKAVGRCNTFEDVRVVGDSRRGAYDRKIKIKDLCCANCGRLLEDRLNKIDGVKANVDFMNMRVILNAENRTAYDKAVYEISHFEDVKIVDSDSGRKRPWREHVPDIVFICVSTVLLALALVFNYAAEGRVFDYVSYGLYVAAYLVVGWKVLIRCGKNIARGRVFDENFLMTIASLGAFALGFVSGDGFFEGVVVMLLYQVGELFQALAVGASRSSISELMDLKSEAATLLREDGSQTDVNPEDLHVGDRILVRAGEKIPADGIIEKGASSIDMKSLNGEPVPRDVKEGDEILSGGVNVSGVLEVRVCREYEDCAVAKILDMVENATAAKAEPEKFITKFARIYTPIVCALAVVIAGLVPTFVCLAGGSFLWDTYYEWIYIALNFLLISCPCAMVISVPLSYFSGIGRCADFGILVKGSTNLDELARATVAAFDKTGTLTEGGFKVTGCTSERALSLAAAAERLSSHPIAGAFEGVGTEDTAESCEEIAGRGIRCLSGGETLLCGNAKLLRENGVEFEETESVSTVVYVALGGKFVGAVYIDDSVKEGAGEAIAALKAEGFRRCVMLTGDSSSRAEGIAESLGLDECRAGLLPDEKLSAAEEMKRDGGLMYVGDGINDAPVMVTADCSVSMGKVGSDAAIEASDIVLLSDDVRLIPKARRIAKGTRRIVFENIIGALAVKFAIMVVSVTLPVAAAVTVPLTVGIVADVGVMILAVLNAMRIKISYRD